MPIIVVKPRPKPEPEPEPRRPPAPFRVTREQLRDPAWCAANARRRSEALRAGLLEIVDG
jgi:hypothetical protein